MIALAFAGASACVDAGDRFAELDRVGASTRVGATTATRLPGPGDVTSGDPLIDAPLMVALAQAQNFHEKARVYRADGKLDDAIAAVRSVMALPFPAGAPEGEDVVIDARALLASLLVERGDLQGALAVASEGIDGARRDSFFVANLLSVRGRVHGLIAEALDRADPPGDASAERRAAIIDLDRSIEINLKIQAQLAAQVTPSPSAVP
jgi:hypothetical protein